MEAIRTIWSFVVLFGLLAFVQLMGVSVFFLVKRYQHFVAHFSGFLIPIFLSVGLCWFIFIYRYYYLHPDDHDGGQLLGALGVMALAVACPNHCWFDCADRSTLARANLRLEMIAYEAYGDTETMLYS